MNWVVDFSRVGSVLAELPPPIRSKLLRWAKMVNEVGLHIVRRSPDLHDEPLKGRRSGQRSIRLNRSWRAIYTEDTHGKITIVQIQEVSKHDY